MKVIPNLLSFFLELESNNKQVGGEGGIGIKSEKVCWMLITFILIDNIKEYEMCGPIY